MPPSKRRNKGKQESARIAAAAADAAQHQDDANATTTTTTTPPKDQLVLTSGKRRGVYECDYCHADISQVPRIRCAKCADFDLCLDCFATTDHSAAIARLKALGQAHADAVSTSKSGVSAAAANHDESHGYRVADSTRYPLFPQARVIVPSRPSSVAPIEDEEEDAEDAMDTNDDKDDDDEESVGMDVDSDSNESSKKKSSEKEESEKNTLEKEEKKDGAKSEGEESKEEIEKPKLESSASDLMVVPEDPKSMWTVEEDLRLLDAIETCGMGNWADIAEAIAGNGSVNKTPKRCMERYFDDFLGRYGHTLPPYTYVEDESDNEDNEHDAKSDTDLGRSTKRRRTERNFFRSQSLISMSNFRNKKKLRVVPTSSLPDYDKVWPDPYIPPLPNIEVGQEVGRDHAMRAENLFVKTIASASSKVEADKIRKEWTETRLNQVSGPTVLPSHPEDIAEMPGAELAGYMPRRGDFDMEWDNEAENVLADMEFSPNDLPQDRQLKIQVIEIYNAKLDERERRKEFLLSRNLMDYRKNQQADMRLPRDERDLVRRMRLFERHHTPEEHKQFIAGLLKAKRLRKEIAKLQMYRRMGIKTLAEAEKYELDKNRREYHKFAQLQKEEEAEKAKAAAVKAAAAKEAATMGGALTGYDSATSSSSLWKQYKTTDRKGRRSVNRTGSAMSAESNPDGTKPDTETSGAAEAGNDDKSGTAKENEENAKPASDSPDAKEAAKDPKDVGTKTDQAPFNIVNTRGYELLSSKEVALCEKLHLLPAYYLEIKKALIQESLSRGLLDREGNGSSRRSIVKIDAEKRGDVIDFMVRAGWISTKVGASATVVRSS